MQQLPDGLTRYTGANAFTAEDAAGNVFAVFQGPADSGVCVMRRTDGTIVRVAHPPILGRPSLECNPLAGLWIVGNKEVSPREFPPRYRIAEYVPFASAPGGGGPVAAEDAEALPNDGAPYRDNFDVFGNRNTALTPMSAWGDFLRLGLFVSRFNKLAKAVAQLQRLAKKAGWLE